MKHLHPSNLMYAVPGAYHYNIILLKYTILARSDGRTFAGLWILKHG